MVKLEMKKTEKPVSIPIEKRAFQILDAYKEKTGKYFPKPISEQKLNEYIKELCSKVKLLQKDVIINTTENNRSVANNISKYSLVSTHTMRRCFATNAALDGIPFYAIMPNHWS